MKPLLAQAVCAVTLAVSAAHSLGQPAKKPVAEAPPQAAPAPKTKPDLRQTVDALSETDASQLIQILKETHIAAEKITETELTRATVQGLLERFGGSVSVLAAPSDATPVSAVPLKSEWTQEGVAYVRLGAMTPANLAALDDALANFSSKRANALVLDLRATPAGSQFEAAAEVCKRFCPKGQVLFTIKRAQSQEERILTSNEAPRFEGILIVLVDSDCAGASEAIAATLRSRTKAMILGQKTQGEAAEFAELPLPSGKLLRVPVGQVVLPEGTSVFPGGLTPDLAVPVPQATTDAVLKAADEKGIQALITETGRPRMNEAALVAGINPEIEAYQSNQQTRAQKNAPPLRDLLLQRALDLVATLRVYEKKEDKK
jgi:C-terminal processing protease CtpA/Prc